MGYACPVCGAPEVDGRHLANHVAFTALTGDAAHEDWLDEHVPEWGQLGEDALAEEVVPHAEETDVADAFDDDGGGAPAVDPQPGRAPAPTLDDAAADVLEEARDYTRKMAEGATDGDPTEGDAEGDRTDGGEGDTNERPDEDGADSATGDETE